jgi:hypothetical protein
VLVDRGPLQPVSAATTVRVRDGETEVTAGPFAENWTHAGGFLLLDCADMDEAVQWGVRDSGRTVRVGGGTPLMTQVPG